MRSRDHSVTITILLTTAIIAIIASSCYAVLGFSSKARIVGGKTAKANMAPFIVSIQYDGVHYCAGSILNENWVLTAAHCISSRTLALSSKLVAGTLNVQATTGSTVQIRSITNYVIHDLYTGGIAPYDIAMIYTKEKFHWNSAVRPVVLPTANAVPTGTANIYGWGSTTTTSSGVLYAHVLQVATDIAIISLEKCETELSSMANTLHPPTNLCTVGVICTADSGGPLVVQQKTTTNGQATLIGIISWGKLPCGHVNSPSVYVRVSSFNAWIAQNQLLFATRFSN